MKNTSRIIHFLYLMAAPIVLLATIPLRSVALLTQYEATIGRYATPTLSVAVGAILAAVTVLLIVFSHEMRGLFVSITDYRDLASLFSGVFSAIALAFFAVTFPLGMLKEPIFILSLAVAAALFALVGAVLFVYRGFRGDAAGGAPALLALPLALLGLPVILVLTFTSTLRIGDPAVTLATVSLVAMSFFFLGEARIALGRAKWALHTCMTVLAAIFAGTHAIPNLIYYTVRGTALLGNIALDFVLLGVLLYTLARLFATYAAARHEDRAATHFAMGMTPPATEAPVAAEEAATPTTEEAADE